MPDLNTAIDTYDADFSVIVADVDLRILSEDAPYPGCDDACRTLTRSDDRFAGDQFDRIVAPSDTKAEAAARIEIKLYAVSDDDPAMFADSGAKVGPPFCQ
jgi:hypothetical protein